MVRVKSRWDYKSKQADGDISVNQGIVAPCALVHSILHDFVLSEVPVVLLHEFMEDICGPKLQGRGGNGDAPFIVHVGV